MNRRALLLGAMASLAMVGCGSTASPETASSTQDSPPNAVIPKSLQFSAPLVGGGQFDGEAVHGRPVAFWFWAPT